MPELGSTVPRKAWQCNAQHVMLECTHPLPACKPTRRTWKTRLESATTVMKCLAAAASLAAVVYPWVSTLM